MGKMHETVTARQMCEMTGEAPDTLRMRYAKLRKTNPALFPDPWRIDGELTPDQINALVQAGERKGSAPKKDNSVATFATDVTMRPEQGRPNEVAPQGESRMRFDLPQMWRTKLFAVLAFLLVVSHAGLIWYDMGLLWKTPGLIGGGVVFTFILSGMILMSEKAEKMEEIRENMLWAVAILEALAVVVHRGAFSRKAGEAYAAGFGIEYIWAISAVICLCSIGATIFYQKVIRL